MIGKKLEIIRDKWRDNISRYISRCFESKSRIVRDISSLFETKKEKQDRKENEKIIKYNIIRKQGFKTFRTRKRRRLF